MTRELLDALWAASAPTASAWGDLDAIVRRAATAIKRSNNPPCHTGNAWTQQDADDLTQEFWSRGRADKVIQAATDDQHLRALVFREMKNLAIAELRRSGRAALRDRLTDVLAHGEFVRDGSLWRLPDHPNDVTYQGSRRDLLEAAFAVPVDRIYVKADSQRESSFASREQIAAMLQAVLERAGAAVPLVELEAVARRWLNLHPPAAQVSLAFNVGSDDEPVELGERIPADVEPIELTAVAAGYVERIWDRLRAEGRELLLYMDPKKNSTRDTAPLVGYGRDKVARVIAANKDILREELADLARDEQAAVLRHLKDRQRRQLLLQTDLSGGALHEVENQ